MFNTEEIMTKFNLIWQGPVITEKTFYEQEKNNSDYAGIPWATIIDKKYDIRIIYKLLIPYFKKNSHRGSYRTCCQHIRFKNLIPLFKSFNIRTVYTPHKTKQLTGCQGITFISCPLYAVNIENQERNIEFRNVDFVDTTRPYLYSFIGAYNPRIYISDIRKKIFDMTHPKEALVRSTNQWHFEYDVYGYPKEKSEQIIKEQHTKATREYNKVLINSRFSLCPSGSGPNSIRLWESLACGAIPILLADTLDLPSHPLWEKAILQVQEKDLYRIPTILANISLDEEQVRRRNCLKIYKYFKNNYANTSREIIHYCCGTYFEGATGGVARYDYQIYLIYPHRRFFKGPIQKNSLHEYLKKCKNPLIITDNHLACDIPNEYEVILVHHGCAKVTADRNPDWGEPWRSLCTNGQNRMLTYRNPENTTIISISKDCTDSFTKYYGNNYLKFPRIDILHTSELDETRYKKTFNSIPNILGNWKHVKKGSNVIHKLIKYLSNMKFQQLSCGIKNGDFIAFNKEKQDIYLKNDMFLQLSNSEGNAYATLDAFICGLVVVATNVGACYGDVPEDCFVKLDWKRINDIEYVAERIKYAWENREKISKKGREWYMQNCRFQDWKQTMNKYVQEKHIKQLDA